MRSWIRNRNPYGTLGGGPARLDAEANAQAWRYVNGWLIGLALGLGYCWGSC